MLDYFKRAERHDDAIIPILDYNQKCAVSRTAIASLLEEDIAACRRPDNPCLDRRTSPIMEHLRLQLMSKAILRSQFDWVCAQQTD